MMAFFGTHYVGSYFLVLDIETSTKVENDKPVATWLNYGILSVAGAVSGGKHFRFVSWADLDRILTHYNTISRGFMTVCYVHNLSYETEFLIRNLSPIKNDTLIAVSPHNPIKYSLEKYPQIEFRDTLVYSQKRLAKIGDEIGLPKLDSDYRFMLPEERPTLDEWVYCERDTDIPALYIKKESVKYNRPFYKLPLTATGKIREMLYALYDKYEDKPEWDILPSESVYRILTSAFYGGIVIANPQFLGDIIEDVYSYDRTSAYPYSMLKYRFPRTWQIDLHPEQYQDTTPQAEFWVGTMILYNVRSKYTWGWLPSSRVKMEGHKDIFNGKIINADCVSLGITNVDFDTVLKTYDVEGWEFLEVATSEDADYLPRQYIELVQTCAERKTELKKKVAKHPDDLELAREYQQSKADLNGIYGMCVESMIHEQMTVGDDFEWSSTMKEYPQRKKHYKRNYGFGVYITAYARKDLIAGVLANEPDKLIYTDTDSIKTPVRPENFVDPCEPLGEGFSPAVNNFGLFECEHNGKPYDAFRTWGAKKYAVQDGDKCAMTVAGLPKPNESHEGVTIGSIEEFTPGSKKGKLFPKCKLARAFITTDETEGFGRGGCALYEVGYTLNITDDDRIYLYSKWGKKLW